MSRATHDFQCGKCRASGKVPDDVIVCPKCGASIEGKPVSAEVIEAIILKLNKAEGIKIKIASNPEIKG